MSHVFVFVCASGRGLAVDEQKDVPFAPVRERRMSNEGKNLERGRWGLGRQMRDG